MSPILHPVGKCKSLNKLYFLIYIRTSGVLPSSAHAIATSYISFDFLIRLAVRLFKFMHVEFHICHEILFHSNVHVWLSYQHVYRFKLFKDSMRTKGIWCLDWLNTASTHARFMTHVYHYGSMALYQLPCLPQFGQGTWHGGFPPFFPWKLTKPCVRACRFGARRLTCIAE